MWTGVSQTFGAFTLGVTQAVACCVSVDSCWPSLSVSLPICTTGFSVPLAASNSGIRIRLRGLVMGCWLNDGVGDSLQLEVPADPAMWVWSRPQTPSRPAAQRQGPIPLGQRKWVYWVPWPAICLTPIGPSWPWGHGRNGLPL